MLENVFAVFSAYGRRNSSEGSLLVGRSLDDDVNVVFSGDGDRLIVADVAVRSFKFQVVVAYAPNIAGERSSFFRWLASFPGALKRLVLVGDWKAILDPKIDKVRRGVIWMGRCENSLIDLMVRYDLVDSFRLDHPGRKMWTWLDSFPSVWVGSYLDGVLVRRADCDFVSCPTFLLIGQTDHKLVRVSVWIANRPSLAGYWKFKTSLLEIRDFWDRLESLIKRVIVGAFIGIRCWVYLKYRIRDFATKYGRQLNSDWTRKAKSIEDRLSRTVERGSLNVKIARRDLQRESSECYNGFVVRTRLEKKSSRRSCEIERDSAWGRIAKVSKSVYQFCQVPGWACTAVESGDMWRLSGALLWSLYPLFWSPASGVSQLFSWLPPSWRGGSG